VQTVPDDDNEPYSRLLKELGELTGVPVVLNTSFNDKGEPIVETPQDAIRTFLKTGMDQLVMEDFVVSKDGW
jgi:carbamoyltransferase